MHRLYKTLTPFLLAMTLGLLVHGFVNRTKFSHAVSTSAPIETNLEILSVPEVDFPDELKKSGFIFASVRLQALLDADGKVKNVRPYPMLPYGVPESEAGKGQYVGYTSARTTDGFVEELPFGLTALAIEQISKTEFIPRRVDGQAKPELVFVIVQFRYSESTWTKGCNDIEVQVINSEGPVWRGNIWKQKDLPCVMI